MRFGLGISAALAVALALGVSASWAQEEAPAEERVVIDRRPLLERVERLRDDLVVVDEHLPGRQTAAHEALDRMRSELRALRVALREAPPAPAPAAGEPRAVLSEADFAALRESFRSATFTKPQIEVVRQSARHAWFSTDQVVLLLGDAFNDDVRIEAAALLYPRVTDPRRFHLVVDAMDFQGSKEKLRARLREIDERE